MPLDTLSIHLIDTDYQVPRRYHREGQSKTGSTTSLGPMTIDYLRRLRLREGEYEILTHRHREGHHTHRRATRHGGGGRHHLVVDPGDLHPLVTQLPLGDLDLDIGGRTTHRVQGVQDTWEGPGGTAASRRGHHP